MFPRRIEILEIKKEGYKYTDKHRVLQVPTFLFYVKYLLCYNGHKAFLFLCYDFEQIVVSLFSNTLSQMSRGFYKGGFLMTFPEVFQSFWKKINENSMFGLAGIGKNSIDIRGMKNLSKTLNHCDKNRGTILIIILE